MTMHDATMTAASYADRLHALFAGSDKGHGYYDPNKVSPAAGGKVQPKHLTPPGPATVALWADHLAGKAALGVVPIMAGDLCRWGCIDIDQYHDLSHADLVAEIAAREMPLVVCRSKSGGAHLFAFATEPVPAATVRRALQAVAAALGYKPSTEVFPKQVSAAEKEKGGSWLNMPYFRGEETDRYAYKAGGLAMTVSEFLSAAEAAAVPASVLEGVASGASQPKAKAGGAVGGDAPRSLGDARRRLSAFAKELESVPKGESNTLLNNAALAMGGWHRDTDISRDAVETALRTAFEAHKLAVGASQAEADAEFSEVWPRAFEDGIAGYEFRGASGGNYPVFEKVVRIMGGDETEFEVRLVGCEMFIANARQMARYGDFLVRCVSVGKMFLPMKQDAWAQLVTPALAGAEIRHLPVSETLEGQIFDALDEFCTNRHASDRVEDCLLRKAALVEEDGRYYFRHKDFFDYLGNDSRNTFRGVSSEKVGRTLNAIGTDSVDWGKTTKKLRGKTVELRWVRSDMFDKREPMGLPPMPRDPV